MSVLKGSKIHFNKQFRETRLLIKPLHVIIFGFTQGNSSFNKISYKKISKKEKKRKKIKDFGKTKIRKQSPGCH